MGQEDFLEKEIATLVMDKISTPVFLPRKSHAQKELGPWGQKRVRHNLATKQQQYTVGVHEILSPPRND